MTAIETVCVFCGSRKGFDETHRESAERLGGIIAREGLHLVFGGGGIGLMAVVAKAALAEGGGVTGVIPENLARTEMAMEGLDELLVVDSLHRRKQIMFERSDAFVALPGGIGTLDEVVELLLWRQVGLHDKPVVLVNYAKFWDPLLDLLDHLTHAGFGPAQSHQHYIVVDTVDDVLPALAQARTPSMDDQVDRL